MKVQSVFFALSKLFFALSFLMLLSSCSSYEQQASHSNSAQMGDRILSALNNRSDKSEIQVAEVISELTASNGTSILTDLQINTSVALYSEGLLSAVGNENFERLSLLNGENPSVKKQKVQALFTLFPKHAKSIALNLTKYGIYELDELFEVALSSNLDPSIILQATASGESSDIMRIGWGGSGAFSSVVEYNGDIYASSDVTGVWRHERPHWYPVVKGLTNYNITGLLVHNNTLLAATKKQILKLGDDNVWSPIGLELNTYRNTTLQLHSTSANGTTCFAALEPKIGCIDEQGNVTKQDLSISKLKGVYFSEDSDYLYGFNANTLFRIDIFDGSHTLEYTFPKNILRISKLSDDSEPLIFTQNGIYELGSFATVNIDLNNKSIVNVLIDSSSAGRHFVALGGQWNATIHELTAVPSGLSIGSKLNIVYDSSLPYRQWRKSMTKPIGMPHTVKGKIWFSDYWGIYAYDVNSNQFYEKSYDASNFVGTDIHIANDTLYITAMDNGLVSMPLNRPNKFTPIFPRKSSDWLLAGHAWSVNSNDKGVFATLSPWNLSQDYILTADKENNFQNVQKIDDLASRKDTSTFWGQSFSRKLVLSDGIFVYKDGLNGGLFKLEASPRENDNDIQESTSKKIFATERNRVYRALTIYNGLLVSYHIDEQKTLHFNDIVTGELIKKVDAPVGLWAFDLEVIDGSLYLLGSRSGAVIYRFNEVDETFSEIVKVPTASAFLSIKNAPDNSLTIAGAIDWSGRPTGKVLLNKEGSDEWVDATCLMPNESGVVDVEFTSDSQYVYLLQQVGSVVRFTLSSLHNHEGC
ncbi:hypothetical protein ACOJR9_08030 [Alteromonas sp. A081]|uniref:hypothetical protein n=1 Tax=Alteromonas sp. A081 TaxID=3410269 RepID=UPI003B983F26